MRASPGSSAGEESTCNAGDPSSIPESGRSPGEGTGYPLQCSWASLVAQMIKNPPAMWETCNVGKISWKRAWQLTPVFLPGGSPWTEEPGRLQSMASESERAHAPDAGDSINHLAFHPPHLSDLSSSSGSRPNSQTGLRACTPGDSAESGWAPTPCRSVHVLLPCFSSAWDGSRRPSLASPESLPTGEC